MDKDQIEAETGYTLNAMVHITIYDNDPGFNAESDMMTAYSAAQIGNGNAGKQSDYVYKANVGGNTAAQSGEYPFKAGGTYYAIFCVGVNDSAGWVWFPEAVTFTYPVVEGIGNYPSTNADWGINAVVQEDGSVLITYDKEKVNASKDGWSSAQANIAIYDEDPQFTAVSNMTTPQEGDEQDKHPYSDASVGQNNAGQTSAGAASYLVLDGDSKTSGDANTNPTYPFEEGQRYWIVVCDSNGSGWYWNYQPFVLTYELPGEEPTPTPTTTAAPTTTATATADVTETAATTEAATTEAAATTAAATGTQSTDDTDDGGDFSVLIYLAAALAAGGVAAFAFRKKNRA